MPETTTDLTRGVYRRQYAGFISGKRINTLSLEAEAWFWRVHSIADDYGNLRGDEFALYGATAGRRMGTVTIEQVGGWVRAMIAAGLLMEYTVASEPYLHVDGFSDRQTPRNGKRVHRVAASPFDVPAQPGAESESAGPSWGIQIDPVRADETKGIQINPDASSATNTNTKTITITKTTAAQECGEPATPTSPPPSPDYPNFECIAGRRTQDRTWSLTETHLTELTSTFAGVEVAAECRKAWGWLRANPEKRKTAGGMKDFLYRWLSRVQNTGRSVGNQPVARPGAAARVLAAIGGGQ